MLGLIVKAFRRGGGLWCIIFWKLRILSNLKTSFVLTPFTSYASSSHKGIIVKTKIILFAMRGPCHMQANLSSIHINPLWARGYLDELGDFIPPLMLRLFEPIIVNICFNRPLACRSQLHNEGAIKRSSIQLSQSCNYQLGQLVKILFISSKIGLMWSLLWVSLEW